MQQLPTRLQQSSSFPKDQTRVLSLGGCVTHDTCMYAKTVNLIHVEHLWRRPTISLMSGAPKRFPFLGGDFPPELTRYWQDDFRKSHLKELTSFDADALVFDITRDIFCKVIELEDFRYVTDPMSVKGLLWHGDSLTDDKIDSLLGGKFKRIGFADDDYFQIWKLKFDEFVESISRFKIVVLNRMYFTARIASERAELFGDALYVDSVNEFLDRAYCYIRNKHGSVLINTIPRKLFLTGSHVSWNGPTYTHIIPEATSMFSENIRRYIIGDTYAAGEIFIKNSILRAKQHEDLIQDQKSALIELSTVAAERDALRGKVVEADGQRAHLLGELGALAGERDVLREKFAEAEGQRVRLLSELSATAGERDVLRGRLGETEGQRMHLVDELSAVASERDTVREKLAEAEGQRMHLVDELSAVASERDAVREKLAETERQRSHLVGELGDVTSERDQSREKLAEAEGQRSHLMRELGNLSGERDALREKLVEAQEQRSRFVSELGSVAGERDALQERLAESERQRTHLTDELSMVAGERDALLNKLSEAEGRTAKFESELSKRKKSWFVHRYA